MRSATSSAHARYFQTLTILATVGIALVATGCSGDGESSSGGGNGSLPISNQPATSSTLPTSSTDADPDDTPPAAPAGSPSPQPTLLSSNGRLHITVAGLAMAAEPFMLSGQVNGNILSVSSKLFNGNATINDGRFEGTVQFALNRPRLDCSGNVKITGNISSKRLSGRVTGVPDCSVDSAPPITSIIDGRF